MIKKKMILLQLLVSTGLFFYLLVPISARDSKTYKSELFNFSVEYPADYQVKEISGIVAFVSPRKDSNDTFSENVNIVVEKLDQAAMNLDQYHALSKENLSKLCQNFNLINEKKVIINGLEAYKITYTSEQNRRILKFLQVCLIHKNSAYVITYAALAGEFDNYLPDALLIINSFKI